MNIVTRRNFSRLLASIGTTGAMGSLLAPTGLTSSLPMYDAPWTPLFNGTDMEDWTFYQEGVGSSDTTNAVVVEQGMIHMLGPRHTGGQRPGFGHIATKREYANYHLRLEFKFGQKRFEPRLLAKRNSGLLYHMFPEKDRVWPNAIELQIQESDVGDAIMINTRCYPGADLGGTPAWPSQSTIEPRPVFPSHTEPRQTIERQWIRKNGDFEKLNDWNTIEVLAIDNKAAHLVNGRIVNSLFEIVGQDVRDRSQFRPLNKGRIGLELEGAEIFFRNIEIRSLAA